MLQKPFSKVQVDSVNKVCDCDMGNLNPVIDPIVTMTIPITKAIYFIRNGLGSYETILVGYVVTLFMGWDAAHVVGVRSSLYISYRQGCSTNLKTLILSQKHYI